MNVTSEEEQIDSYHRGTYIVHIIVGAFIGPIGVGLNFFSAFVFLTNRKLNHKTNMGLLYGAVALADAVTLLMIGIVFDNLLPLLGITLLVSFDITCKIGQFIWRLTMHMSSWLQVMVAFERFLFINYPTKSAHLRQKRVLLLMILALFCSLFLLNSINFSYFVLRVEDKDNQTVISGSECTSNYTVTIIAENLYSLFHSIIPFALMVYFNARTIKKVTRSRRLAKSMNLEHNNRAKKDAMFTRSMLALNLLFLLSFSASLAFYAYQNMWKIINGSRISVLEIARDEFYLMIALGFGQFYQASTFCINLAFNKIFRKETILMIKSRKLSP
nr:G protein-coupled receptor [Proales similis]